MLLYNVCSIDSQNCNSGFDAILVRLSATYKEVLVTNRTTGLKFTWGRIVLCEMDNIHK